jgi:8-oxo-dGTP diphosphatase
MILHNTASVLVEKDGKFLLVKRADGPELGYWAVPGGHVDKGETVYQAIVREVKEEVGKVKITKKKPVYIFIHDIELGHRHRAHVFPGKVSGRLRAGSDAKRLGFFTIKQMKRMNLTHYTKKIFNGLYSRVL